MKGGYEMIANNLIKTVLKGAKVIVNSETVGVLIMMFAGYETRRMVESVQKYRKTRQETKLAEKKLKEETERLIKQSEEDFQEGEKMIAVLEYLKEQALQDDPLRREFEGLFKQAAVLLQEED